jgi:hypothetical protein
MINIQVGSANLNLEKHIEKIANKNIPSCFSRRLASYLFANNKNVEPDGQHEIYAKGKIHENISFKLVKINCRKQASDSYLKKPANCLKDMKFDENFLIKFIILFVVIFVICSLISYTFVYFAFNFFDKNYENLTKKITKRSVNIYSTNREVEWSNEKISTIYELDIRDFLNESQGFALKNEEIKSKLEYVKNIMRTNCVQLVNIESFYNLSSNTFMDSMSHIDLQSFYKQKLHAFTKIIELSHKMSIRVNLFLLFLLFLISLFFI